jgi:hypothetical protein
MVRNENPGDCFYFCSTVENSEHFPLPWNGSERYSESFRFRGTAGISPEETNCSVFSVFRGIIFLSEIANPSTEQCLASDTGLAFYSMISLRQTQTPPATQVTPMGVSYFTESSLIHIIVNNCERIHGSKKEQKNLRFKCLSKILSVSTFIALNAVTVQIRLTNKLVKTISRIFIYLIREIYMQLAWRRHENHEISAEIPK